MNSFQFLIKLALSLACLALTAVVIVRGENCLKSQATSQPAAQTDSSSAELMAKLRKETDNVRVYQMAVQKQQADVQADVQQRQDEINRGTQSQQIGTNLLKDIATLAYSPDGKVKNENLKELLQKNDINVTVH